MSQPKIHVRPASSAHDDGLRLVHNFDSQLSWLASIGSSAQWGHTSRGSDEVQQAKFRDMVAEGEENQPWSRDWVRCYIAEVDIKYTELSSDVLDLLIYNDTNLASPSMQDVTVRLPVAGMILKAQSSSYVQSIIPENDDNDPFVFLLYLLSDRRTTAYGKGAGAALIERAKQDTREIGLSRICVDCWRGNDNKLVKYYEHQGFTQVGDFDAESGEDDTKWPGTVLEMRL